MPENNTFIQPENQNLPEPTQKLSDVKEVKDTWVAPKLGTPEEQRAAFNENASSEIVDNSFNNINSENEQLLSQGLIARADANPARYMHASKMAQTMGISDVNLVYDNLDEFEQRLKQQEKERYIRRCDNLKDMCIDDPTLLAKLDNVSAGQLKRINDNLVIYGGIDSKNGLSGKFARATYTFNKAEQDFEVNELGYAIIGTTGTERAKKIQFLREAEAKLEDMPELDTSGWNIGDLTLNAVEQLPYQLRTTGAMLAGAGAGAAAGSVASPAGSVVAGYAGAVAGRAVAFYEGYKAESGSIMRELLKVKDADGKPLDDDIVDIASRFYGGFSSAIEQIGAEGMMKAMGLGSITKIGLKNAIKEAVKDKTKREIFLKIAKDFVGAISSEGAEEFMQQLLQSGVERTAQDFARLYRGDNYEADNFIDGLIDDLGEAAEAGIQGAKASIIMAGVPSAARTARASVGEYRNLHSKVKETKAKADIQILDNVQKEVQAYAESDGYEPKTVGALFQRVKRQNIYQDVFVDVEDAKALMQTDAMQANKELLTKNGLWSDIERQISAGEELGTPVRIGFADFGEKVMPSPDLYTAWKDVIKTYEDGITLKEIKASQTARANWLTEGQKRAANKDANFEYAYKAVMENSVYANMPDMQRKQQAELAAGLMVYMAEQTNTNIQEFVRQHLPQFELSLNGEVNGNANVTDIIAAVRDEALNNETQNLINVSKRVARKDINAIKKLLLSKIDNPNTADVKKYVQIVNAISDMKLNIEGMSDEDIINHLAEYTKSGELTLDIKRNDDDRIKSGLYSASETALADIQANTGGGDYVLVGGGRVPVNYEIVELNDMITSHNDAGAINENYPQELQPRDRSRTASDVQITSIVNNFAPERVAKAEIATEGAPIVTQQGFVAVGNGRAMAIRQVYNNAEVAQTYKNYLSSKGFDLTGFDKPVLVRRLAMDMSNEQLRALVDDANTAGTMQYSDSENALRDAAKMSGNLIDLLDIDAEIDSAANKRFLTGFFSEVVPTAERNAYLDKDDKITRKGVERVENALVAKLLPDARFLSVLVENPDNNIRKVTKSLAKAAPAIIGFENDIAAGRISADYSIAGDVSGAVELLKRAKDRGVSASDFIKMTDMFADPIEASTQAMVQLFENTTGASDFLGKILNYIHNANEFGDLEQGSMFAVEPLTKLQLLERESAQQTLFQRAAESLFKSKRAEKSRFISDLRAAERISGNVGKTIRLGELPAVYKAIGIPAAKVNTNKRTIIKDTIEKHVVSLDIVENLPDLFANPIMIFSALDKSSNKNSYVAILDAFDKDGKQMIAALSPAKDEGGYHMITSFYGRNNIDNMIKTAFSEGKVKYIQSKKNSLLTGHNAYLSQAGNSIIQKSDIVNSSVAYFQRGIRDNLTGDLFDMAQNNVNNTKPLPIAAKKQVEDLFSYTEKQDGVKELPIFSSVESNKKIEKTYAPSKQIEDTGDSLLGNLKRNAKIYSWEELAGMNDLLRKKYVAKNYIYQKPTIDALRAQGLSNRSAAVVLYVYNSINSKPARGYAETAEFQKCYFDVIHRTMEKTLEYVKKHQAEIENWQFGMELNTDILRAVFPSDETIINRIFRNNKEYNTEALIAGGNKYLSSMMISGYDLKKIDSIVEDSDVEAQKQDKQKEKTEEWQKHFMIAEKAYLGGWIVLDNNGKVISRDLVFNSKEKAEEFARKAYDIVKPQLTEGYTVDFSDMRKALPRRKNNQNVDPQALVDTFGFRGVNFGNWTKQSERQEWLNLSYDSLLDMSEILGIPPRAIGLEGKLGLAFGAQGRAGAAGHFIPEFNEINLTRKNGAGSLAHEWWHALDYYFGDQALGKDFSGKAALELNEQGNLRTETYAAIRNLYEKIATADMSDKEIEDRYQAQVKHIKYNVDYRANEIKRKFAKAKNSAEINKFIDDMVAQDKNYDANNRDKETSEFLDLIAENRKTTELAGIFYNLQYHLKQLNALDSNTSAWRKVSKYYSTANTLNRITNKKNGYWTQKTELGARAFASYINDKVASNDWFNFFLSGHAKTSVLDVDAFLVELARAEKEGGNLNADAYQVPIYPADDIERANINAAFEQLFNTIKVDENNNYRLYQNFGADALGAYLPLERKIVLFRNHNLSTIIHETGHWWLDMLQDVAQSEKASDKLKEDWQTIKNWLGVGDDNIITEEQHEKFARGVETYFMTKQAPSSRLADLFNTFRRWLASVYKDVKELDVDLNDDVVRVFNHMLASEAEIEEYRQANNLKEMFDRADVFGLNPKDFEKYKELAENSMTLANNKHFNDKMLLIYREEQEAYNELKKRLTDRVRDEWCRDKYNRAIYAIYRGKVGDIDIGKISLNEEQMRELFGDSLQYLQKRDGEAIYSPEGLDLQTVADLVGLTIDELKGTLLSVRNRTRKYKELLDRRVHEELGDPVSYDDVQKQVVASIYNDKQASLLHFELNTIGKALGKKSVLEQGYETYARSKIEKMLIKELKPQVYAEQAQKSGDKALQAMERGNREAAYRYKEMQIRNFYLYREAQKQYDIVEKNVKKLKQIGKKEVNTGVEQTYQDAARALLSKVNLARALNSKQQERLGNLAMWIIEQRQNGYEIVVPDKFLHEINQVNYADLTIDDFLSLSDSVKSLIHNGRDIKEFELAGQLVDREKLLAEMNIALKKHGVIEKSASSRKSTKETVAKFWRGLDSFLTGLGFVANRIDNGDTNGIFHKTFLRPLSDAQTLENDLQIKYANKITELTAGLSKETKARMREFVPEAEKNLNGKYTLEDLITIGLNMGNKANLQRLQDGNNFSDYQLNWVKNYLTQEHWDYIQAVWDVLESMYPMLEEHHKKMSGLDMDKVFPVPVQTNYGKYRGGYFPIVYDREFSPEMESKAALFDADYNVATTSKGYTKKRTEVVNAPIKLGLMNVAQHMNTVLHDVAYRGTLRKLWTLANNPEFVAMFDNTIGKEYRDNINELLKSLGNEPNRETRGLAAWEKCLRFMRQRATLIGLGFRLTTALSQPLGFFASIATMTEHKQKQGGKHGGAYYIALGHKELLTNPKIYDWAMASSGELRARLGSQDVSIAKRIRELTKNAGNMTFKEQAEAWAYKAIGYMDFYVANVTWIGAYRQATNEFNMNHNDAVFYADRVMLNSQGTGTTKDTAGVQRANEGWRALTMFYSFFSALYQTSIQLGRDVKQAKSFTEYADLSARFMAMFVIPACLDSLMRGEAPDGDDESLLAWLFDNTFGYFIAGVPVARDIYSSFKYKNSNGSNIGRQANYFGNFFSGVAKAFDGDPNWQKMSKNAMNAFAVATGYPTGGQVADSASYFVGVAAGEINPKSLTDILWGIYKGKERK